MRRGPRCRDPDQRVGDPGARGGARPADRGRLPGQAADDRRRPDRQPDRAGRPGPPDPDPAADRPDAGQQLPGGDDDRDDPGHQRGVRPDVAGRDVLLARRHPRHRPDARRPGPAPVTIAAPGASAPPSCSARSAARRSRSSPTTAASRSPTSSSSATAWTSTTITATCRMSACSRQSVKRPNCATTVTDHSLSSPRADWPWSPGAIRR